MTSVYSQKATSILNAKASHISYVRWTSLHQCYGHHFSAQEPQVGNYKAHLLLCRAWFHVGTMMMTYVAQSQLVVARSPLQKWEQESVPQNQQRQPCSVVPPNKPQASRSPTAFRSSSPSHLQVVLALQGARLPLECQSRFIQSTCRRGPWQHRIRYPARKI